MFRRRSAAGESHSSPVVPLQAAQLPHDARTRGPVLVLARVFTPFKPQRFASKLTGPTGATCTQDEKTENAALEKELRDADVLRPLFRRNMGSMAALTGADEDESYMEYDAR